jgi:hypothetical protein
LTQSNNKDVAVKYIRTNLLTPLLWGSFGNGADILLDIEDEKHCHPAPLVIWEKISKILTWHAQNALATTS